MPHVRRVVQWSLRLWPFRVTVHMRGSQYVHRDWWLWVELETSTARRSVSVKTWVRWETQGRLWVWDWHIARYPRLAARRGELM